MRHFDETYPGNSCGVRVRRQIRQFNLHRYQSPITLLRYYVATPCPFHIATTLRKGPSIKYVYKIFRMFTSLLILSAFHSTYQYCSSTTFAYFSIPFPLAADLLNGWPPNWGPQYCAHCTWPIISLNDVVRISSYCQVHKKCKGLTHCISPSFHRWHSLIGLRHLLLTRPIGPSTSLILL